MWLHYIVKNHQCVYTKTGKSTPIERNLFFIHTVVYKKRL